MKFPKLLTASILKNICKRLLLEVFYKKAVLKNFALFTGRKWQVFCEKIYQDVNNMWQLLTRKHLCWSLFLILSIAKFSRALILKNICKRLLLKMCLKKLFIKRINFTLKNPDFFNIIRASENICFYFMIGFP